MKGFPEKYHAIVALEEFGDLCLFLKRAEVSEVDTERDIISSSEITKTTRLAEELPLIDALMKIKDRDFEKFRFLISILTKTGETNVEGDDEITIEGISSRHCAIYKEDIFISLKSDKCFDGEYVAGILNGTIPLKLRNLSKEGHAYVYWKELGYREYEVNPKHGAREYIRDGGLTVGIAPETDELGQHLLNQVMRWKNKLYAVDEANGMRIFEFRHSYANKYHAFLQDKLDKDIAKKIYQVWKERKEMR